MTKKQEVEKEIGEWITKGLCRNREINSVVISRAFNKKISTVNILLTEYANRKGLVLRTTNVKLSRKTEKCHSIIPARMEEFLIANIEILIGGQNRYNPLYFLKRISDETGILYFEGEETGNFHIKEADLKFTFSKLKEKEERRISLNQETQYEIFEEIFGYLSLE